MLDLAVKALNKTDAEGNVIDILPAGQDNDPNTVPGVGSSDQQVALMYSLLMNPNKPLDAFGYIDNTLAQSNPDNVSGRDYLFVFGEDETLATIGNDKTAIFKNIAGLAALDVEDYLTLRFLQNSDTENVLWEFAFEYLALDTQTAGYDAQNSETLYVSADNPTLPLQAMLVGYANRDARIKQPVQVIWNVSGSGAVDQRIQTDGDLGVFYNNVTLPSIAGASATVTARLSTDGTVKALLPAIEVIPGVPAQVDATITGNASVTGAGELDVNVKVYDQAFNRVADTTPVDLTVDGEGIVLDYEPGTLNGEVNAKIRGGASPGDYQLTVKAGDVIKQYPFTIHPLQVSITAATSTVEPGKSIQLTATVVDNQGKPVANRPVDFFSDGGIIDNYAAVTDASGGVSVNYFAGDTTGAFSVKARVGLSPAAQMTLQQAFNSGDNPYGLKTDKMIMVGDASQDGSVDYQRYDAETLAIPYTTHTDVSVSGVAGDNVTLLLGTLSDPNLEPVVVLPLREFAAPVPGAATLGGVRATASTTDATGVSSANVYGAVLQRDTPFGAIANSTHFTPGTRVIVPADPGLYSQQPGMRVDFKAAAAGTLVKNGPVVLRYTGDAVVLEVTTDQGVYTLSSGVLSAGVWHTAGGALYNGQLHLEVDGVSLPPVTAPGLLSYGASGLEVGDGFTGNIMNLKWFDYLREPLLTFANGQPSQVVTFAADGTQTFTVQSTGRMNNQVGSALDIQRVAMTTSAGNRVRYINLMSLNAYRDMAGIYAVTAYKGAEVPPINMAALVNPNYQGPADGFFIRSAYAATSPLADGFISIISGAVSFLLPIEDIGIIYQQINLLIVGDPSFDPVQLAISSVSVMTFLPGPGALLRPVLRPISRFYRLMSRNSKAIKAFAGVLDDIVSKAKRGNWDAISSRVSSMVPFLLIASEMLTEPEAIGILIDAVQSTDDVWAWVDYFNLPANGWVGEGDPPAIDLQVAAVSSGGPQGPSTMASVFGATTPVLDFLLPKAHAAGLRRPRFSGAAFGRALKQAFAGLGADIVAHPQNLTKAIKAVNQGLKRTYFESLRRVLSDRRFLAGVTVLAARTGVKRLKDFLRGYSDARIPAPLFIGVVAYLESQYARGELGVSPAAGEQIRDQLFIKYAAIMKDVVIGKTSKEVELKEETGKVNNVASSLDSRFADLKKLSAIINGGGHGAMFHVAMVAYYELIGANIKGIEKPRWVWSYFKPEDIKKGKTFRRDLRYVDIVLGDSEKLPSAETWVELKSLKARKSNAGQTVSTGFNPWTFVGTGKFKKPGDKQKNKSFKYHKQFTLDRIASTLRAARSTKSESLVDKFVPIEISGVNWWFHKFKVKVKTRTKVTIREDLGPKLGRSTTPGSIRYKLTELPVLGSRKARQTSLEVGSTLQNQAYRRRVDTVGHQLIKDASIKNLVLNAMIEKDLIPGGNDIIEVIRGQMGE